MYMETVRSFKMLLNKLNDQKVTKRVAVVCGTDSHSEYAITRAIEAGFATFIMVGDKSAVESYEVFKSHPNAVSFLNIVDPDEAADKAVSLVKTGKADVLMKGIINTDNLLRSILNKEHGILPKGKVLTHLSVAEIPSHSKLLLFTDAAVIPYPTLEQRIAMLKYMAEVCNDFGISKPHLALIHCTEKVSPRFPHSVDYVSLKELAAEGEFGKTLLDGPMDVSTACDIESSAIKGIDSVIGGDADGLMFPNIESGNVFYKTLSLFAKAEIAGFLKGTMCPVVITSRSDSGLTKFYSLATACLITNNKPNL